MMFRNSWLGAVVVASLLVGCGGPEMMDSEPQAEQAPVVEQTPDAPAAEDREVRAMSFWAWQCGANDVALRDYQYGPAVGQVLWGWDFRVDIVDGGWYWGYSPNLGRSGWVLKSYFC